jgi:hypothetical protein
MAVKRIPRPRRSQESAQLRLPNCWVGSWIHSSWAGCWGTGKAAESAFKMIPEIMRAEGASPQAIEMFRAVTETLSKQSGARRGRK